MNLYLVLYLLGNVVFSLGPWSDGSDQMCKAAAASLEQKAREHWRDFQSVSEVPVKPTDIIGDCIRSEKAPYMKDAVRLN